MSEWKGAKPAYRAVGISADGPWLYSWDQPPLPVCHPDYLIADNLIADLRARGPELKFGHSDDEKTATEICLLSEKLP